MNTASIRLNYCHSDEFKQRLYPQTFENCVSNARVGFWGGMFEDLMFSLSLIELGSADQYLNGQYSSEVHVRNGGSRASD